MKRKIINSKSQKLFKLGLLSLVFLSAVLSWLLSENHQIHRHLASHQDFNSLPQNVPGDLTQVADDEIERQAKIRVVEKAEIKDTQENLEIRLGAFHWLHEGKVTSICQTFPWVELVFEADGVLFSGEAPQMMLRAPCSLDQEKEHLKSLLILKKLWQSFAVDKKQFHQGPMHFYWVGVEDFWPRTWNLRRVKLFRNHGESLTVNSYEIVAVRGSPITFDLQSFSN